MDSIDATVTACLLESEDSKAPGVFIHGYCRDLAKQPGWKEEELEEVQRRALAEALVRLHLQAKTGRVSSGDSKSSICA